MKSEERTQQITAYLLGELSELDRVALERELEKDAELRAEKERLAATIGLVKGALSAESLSASSQETLLAAARASGGSAGAGPKPTAWYRSSKLRMAAGFVVLFGAGAFATDAFLSRRGGKIGDVAQAPSSGAELHAEILDPPEELFEEEDRADIGPSLTPAQLRSLEMMGYMDAVPELEGLGYLSGEANSSDDFKLLRNLGYANADDARTSGTSPAPESSLASQLEGIGYGASSTQPSEPSDSIWAYTAEDEGLRKDSTFDAPGSKEETVERWKRQMDELRIHAPGDEKKGAEGSGNPDDQRARALAEIRAALAAGEGAGRSIRRPDAASRDTGESGDTGRAPVEAGPTGPVGAPNSEPAAVPTPPAGAGGESQWFLGHGEKTGADLGEREIDAARRLYASGAISADDLNTLVEGASDLERVDKRTRRLRLLEELESGKAGDLLRGLGYVDPDEDGDLYLDRLFNSCRRRPNESPSAMFFRFWGDNAFELPVLDKLSTFSVDVDTASYTLARRYLAEGRVPEKAQVRTEEFVNYFDSGIQGPTEDAFAIHMDLAPSRFGGEGRQRWMMRVALKGREVADFERDPVALTFVVDTSGSMKTNNRLDLVKTSLRLLLTKLDANDSVAIVAFSEEARLVLPMTSAANRDTVEMALSQLRANGSTNAESGLMFGYAHAADSLTQGASNRVIFLSDGVANVGQTDQDRINADVKRFRDRGIYLNTVGVGFGNHNDVFLEQLADKGNGICDYVDTALEARKAFVENFTGAMQTIARDVKIQVEFDPQSVERYRLLGYENRAIADRDFRNDKVDAGEIGAGHQVTALYELELTSLGDADLPLATTRVRWKSPHGQSPEGRDPEQAFEVAQTLSTNDIVSSFEAAPTGYRKAVLVAQFAEFLRRSVHASDDLLEDLIGAAQNLAAQDDDPDFSEFVQLLVRGRELILSNLPRYDELRRTVDAYRRNHFLRAQYEDVAGDRQGDVLRNLEEQNAQLEQQIRILLRD